MACIAVVIPANAGIQSRPMHPKLEAVEDEALTIVVGNS